MHQGRSERGLDCLGLVVVAAQRAGYDAARYDETGYPHAPDPMRLRERLGAVLEKVPRSDMRRGDVVLMYESGQSTHMGIVDVVGDVEYIIHAYAPARQVIAERLNQRDRHVVAVYRLPEISSG